MRKLFYLILTIVLLSSCGRQTTAQQDGGDTIPFKYAQKLTVVHHSGYTEAICRTRGTRVRCSIATSLSRPIQPCLPPCPKAPLSAHR